MKRTTVKVNRYVYETLRKNSKKKFYNLLDDFLSKHDFDEQKILRELRPYLKKRTPIYSKTVTFTLPCLYWRFLKSLAGLANTNLSDLVNALIQRINYDIEKDSYAVEKTRRF